MSSSTRIRKLLLAGLAALALSGCIRIPDSFLRDRLKDQEKIVNYFKDGKGYSIDTPFEKIRYVYRIDEKGRKACTLMREGLTLFNEGCDRFVDLMVVQNTPFVRNELKEETNEFYDELFSIYQDGLRVERVHEKWKLLR